MLLQKPRIVGAQDKSKEYLDPMVADGSANADTYKNWPSGRLIWIRRLAFVEKGWTYSGNPKEVFDWCEKLEKHLSSYKWQTKQ